MSVQKQYIKLMPPSFSPFQPKKDGSRQIAVLISGGVDSNIAAHLLKQDGWDVLGITMKIPRLYRANTADCCKAEAASVCSELGIAHYFVDVACGFEEFVIKPFRQAYANGETPNPCTDCNRSLKFSLVWDLLRREFGIRRLATGHYARVIETNGRAHLGRAADKSKDQSYFLYGIAKEKLADLIFPLGDSTKQQVRSIAAGLNLSVADRPQSMELCFVGENDYRAALLPEKANQPGDIQDMQGCKIGTHKGIANYTIGQRRGVGFAAGRPLYVGKIDAKNNTISLGTREELNCRSIRANRINALLAEQLMPHQRLFGKIRSYGEPQPCKVVNVIEASVEVRFDQPQFAACPGQKLVLYNNDEQIVAGGTIMSSRN